MRDFGGADTVPRVIVGRADGIDDGQTEQVQEGTSEERHAEVIKKVREGWRKKNAENITLAEVGVCRSFVRH